MSMRGKYDFREPLLVDDNGLYITAAQMQFFLNRPEGEKQFSKADPRFMRYYKNCCLYNLVYDMMQEEDSCAKMYWDPTSETVAVSFPMQGAVSKALAKVSVCDDDEDDEDFDDPFGTFE